MSAHETPPPESAPDKPPKHAAAKPTRDTYWLLEGVSLLVLHSLGGLYVRGAENVPTSGQVLMVANHVSYLDPVSIGDASPRRVVFMAKSELFAMKFLGFLLRGVDSFPIKRGEPDRAAFKNTLAMLGEGRAVCIFPEGKRSPDGSLQPAEAGAGVFAIRTGCPVVPVFVDGSDKMLDDKGRLHRAKIIVSFGEPFIIARGTDKEVAAQMLMDAIARTRDTFGGKPSRRIYPHWIKKPREGSRAAK